MISARKLKKLRGDPLWITPKKGRDSLFSQLLEEGSLDGTPCPHAHKSTENLGSRCGPSPETCPHLLTLTTKWVIRIRGRMKSWMGISTGPVSQGMTPECKKKTR